MSEEKQPSFAEKVTNLTNQMKQTDDGNWALPEEVAKELDEPTQYAVTAERRRRDTQAAYTKAQTELATTKAEVTALAKAWEEDITKSLTAEQANELDELKATDAEAWREKITEYEQKNRDNLSSRRQEIAGNARKETELQRRERLLEEFNEANPDIELTDDFIANELPPKFIKKLENGGTFEEFLDEAKAYLAKGRVIKEGDKPGSGPDLGKTGGTSKPSDAAVGKESVSNYKREAY